jgi:murein DD-endopeptidase MepM/ murein hydrolase activator NlpD
MKIMAYYTYYLALTNLTLIFTPNYFLIMPRVFFAGVFLLFFIRVNAQLFSEAVYPKGYFSNPLKTPVDLSGNFGELRPNHYHMGLDLKTLKKENLPVYAAAGGFISRIKIEPAGFGRAIYINHPNGYTTVYCHLNDFTPPLEQWLKQQQYKLESWKVLLDVPANLFAVNKGDFIAYSGNTGGSQAPHVHFEIRRTGDDVNLNPLLFGLPLADNTAPSILRIALYNRNKSVYEQNAVMVAVKKTGSVYSTTPAIITTANSKISFAITTYDTHNGNSNLNGVFEATIFDNDVAVCAFRMNEVSYNETRYMNAHIDYKTKTLGGPYLQHLSELPGYINSIYKKAGNGGVIDLSDGTMHTIRITVKDAYGNTAVVNTAVKWNGSNNTTSAMPGKMFYPLMLDVFESDQCEFFMGEKSLYDSVHINYKNTGLVNANAVSQLHSIGAFYIPLQEEMIVRIKPNKILTPDEMNRTLMRRITGNKKAVMKVEWQQNWATARFRDFGNFELVVDNEPPQIIPIGFANGSNIAAATRLLITVKDNYESFKNFRAMLDGKWLRFTNDKGCTFIYKFDEKFTPGQHTLVVSVDDEAGNTSIKTFTLTR